MELNHGQYYSVVVKLHKSGSYVNIGRELFHQNANFKTTVDIKAGQSFFSLNGSEWEDIYNPAGDGETGNLCLKAFTDNIPVSSEKLTPAPAVNPTAVSTAVPASVPTGVPKTGDGAQISLWAIMVMLGISGIISSVNKKK